MIEVLRKIINKHQGSENKVKNTYYTELLETFSKDKCAICELLENSVEKYLENLLHEFTMDPVSRRQIRDSFGYCAKHTTQLIRVAENTNQRLSATIVAEDLANTFLKYCRKLVGGGILNNGSVKNNPDCPICLYFSKHERLYTSEFAKGTQKPEFLDKYRENPYICMDHLISISRLIKNRGILKKVLEPKMKEMGAIDRDLNNFIKKFDHRSRENITEKEAAAWISFFKTLNRK
jgi:hypothetical protein